MSDRGKVGGDIIIPSLYNRLHLHLLKLQNNTIFKYCDEVAYNCLVRNLHH